MCWMSSLVHAIRWRCESYANGEWVVEVMSIGQCYADGMPSITRCPESHVPRVLWDRGALPHPWKGADTYGGSQCHVEGPSTTSIHGRLSTRESHARERQPSHAKKASIDDTNGAVHYRIRHPGRIVYSRFLTVHHCFPVIAPIFENVPRHDLVGDSTVLIYITIRHTYISEYTNVELHYNSWITWHNNSNGFVQKTYTQHCLVIPCADIVFNYSDCLCVMAPVPLLVMQTFHRLLLPSNISDSDGNSSRSTTNDTNACSANLQFFLFLSCTETVTPSYSKWSIRYCSHCNIDDSDGYNIPHNW